MSGQSPFAAATSLSNRGSMCREWKATSAATRRTTRFSASQARAVASTGSTSPAITVDDGEAAIAATTSLRSPSRARTSSKGRLTMAIAPLPATSRSRIDLRQISREPSLRVSAPATTAAAISPTEWPITAAGSKPCPRHTSASATCIAKIIGWMTSTAESSSPTSTARGVNPISAANISPTLSIVRPNAGSVASRSRPMPTHCDPCPEKTHTGPIARRFAVPNRTPCGSLPAAAARRAATSSARSAATTPARWVR